MVREISVHQNHEFTSAFTETIDVCGTETELSWTRMQLDFVLTVDALEFLDNVLGAIGGVVIDDNHFHVDFVLLGSFHQEPDDQREVVFLIVGWKQHRVLGAHIL